MDGETKKIQLVPYENTLYTLLIDKIKGKYFQNMLAPKTIVYIPKDAEIHFVENNYLSVWLPLRKEWPDINLEEFNRYAEITKKQFNKYSKNKTDLHNILLAHKNAPIFKEKTQKKLKLS